MSDTQVERARYAWPAFLPKSPSATSSRSRPLCGRTRAAPGVGLSFAAAVIAGISLAALLPVGRRAALITVAGAALLLAIGYARLAPAVRARSWQPARDVIVGGGAVQLGAALLALTGAPGLRASFAVLVTVAGIVAAGAVTRTVRQRTRSIMLVGDRLAVAQCIEHWSSLTDTDLRGVFLVEPPYEADDRPVDVLGVPVIGDLSDVPEMSVEAGADEVIVAPGPLVTAHDVRRLGWALERTSIQVGVTAEVHGAALHRLRPRLVGRRLVMSVDPSARPRMLCRAKAVIDRLGGVLLLALFAPLIGILGLLVWLDSPGPAFFRQVRVGEGGIPFTMYKLRTMRPDAEAGLAELRERNEGAGPLFKMRHDPRVTRIGRILRKTSLDELPQLVNVVLGEMSLIGPRPGLPSEVRRYDDWVSRRLAIKPGMTGSWQVSGRSTLSWDDSVGLDLSYVDNWTLGGDLVIAAKTLRAVAERDGAS